MSWWLIVPSGWMKPLSMVTSSTFGLPSRLDFKSSFTWASFSRTAFGCCPLGNKVWNKIQYSYFKIVKKMYMILILIIIFKTIKQIIFYFVMSFKIKNQEYCYLLVLVIIVIHNSMNVKNVTIPYQQ